MNDENFDKIFGDKLNAGKDFPFSDAKWQKMAQNFDAFQAKRRKRLLWAWLALPLLGLFVLLGWGSWSLYKSQSDIYNLTQEVKMLRQEKLAVSTDPSVNAAKSTLSSVIKSDTVYHHVVVKRYDTIFQTVVRREVSDGVPSSRQDVLMSPKKGKPETTVSEIEVKNIVESKTTISNKPKQEGIVVEKPTVVIGKNGMISKNNDAKTIDKPILTEKEPMKDSLKNIITQPMVDSNKAIVEKKIDTTIAKRPLSMEAEKPSESPKMTEIPLEKQKTKRLPIIKPIKIAGYDIGVSGGLAVIDGENILRQNGLSMGGRGGILLSDRWKVFAEVEYVALSYEVDKINGLQDIPTIAPPTANDELKEVRIEQPYWYYSLGLQYALTHTRLKPYIGVSAFGQSKLEEKFEYQFRNKQTREEVLVRKMRNDDSFQMPFLRLQVGAEYPVFGKIKAQLESSYDVNVGNVSQFKPLWQVKGAVLYRF